MTVPGCRRPCCDARLDVGPGFLIFVAAALIVIAVATQNTGDGHAPSSRDTSLSIPPAGPLPGTSSRRVVHPFDLGAAPRSPR